MAATRASSFIAQWLESPPEGEHRTQAILAEKVSEKLGRRLHQATISAIVRGEQVPRGDLMAALHATLGVEFGWWLEAAQEDDAPASERRPSDHPPASPPADEVKSCGPSSAGEIRHSGRVARSTGTEG